MRRVFITDCEGPISKNDNAFEITAHCVPDGDKLFTVVSRYDDVLADVVKRPGYEAGDTLKLILPFLKANGVTDKAMQEFSAQNLILIPHSKETLRHVRKLANAFIVSTSYEHYIRALCQALDFPFENTCCTKLSIDGYRIVDDERARLERMAREIAAMPVIEIPLKASSLKDFSEADRGIIKRLDEIFWREIAEMDIGRMLRGVNPVGGEEKAVAVRDVAHDLDVSLESVMYVGDSITDEKAFQLVRRGGGLTVSFNGNQYAVRNAEIVVQSETSLVTAVIADVFCAFGREEAVSLVETWSRDALTESDADKNLLGQLLTLYPQELPKVDIVTRKNREILAAESSAFRKRVRGEAVARLG